MYTSARTADTFTEFQHSLMSVGKTSDDGMISIFKKVVSRCTRNRAYYQNERKTYSDRSPRLPWQILYSTNSTMWAMATTTNIKESQASTVVSKQYIQIAINGTSFKMDARGLWISSKINMGESNKGRELCGVTSTHQTQHQQGLPGHKQNSKRSHESNTKDCSINQMGPTGVIHLHRNARQEGT